MSESTEFTSDGNESSSTEMPTPVELLTSAAAVTSFGHAVADYLMSGDDPFNGFCAFLGINDDEGDVTHMREMLPAIHNTFAGMSARAQRDLILSQVMTMFGSPADQN